MANPQKENGYTAVANEILEAVYKLRLNGTQFCILLVVWRYTYGFSRKNNALSVNFISNATGISKRTIKSEIKYLINCKILHVEKTPTYTEAREISFNKNYDKWDCTEGSNRSPGEQMDTRGADVSNRGEQNLPWGGEQSLPQENKLKTNSKDTLSLCAGVRNIYKYIATTAYSAMLNPTQQQELIKFIDDDGFDPDVIIEVIKEKAVAGKPFGHALLRLNDLLQMRVLTMEQYKAMSKPDKPQKPPGTKFSNFTGRQGETDYSNLGLFPSKNEGVK